MREIKFRGRNPLTKQWEYGFLITVDLSSEKLSKNLSAIIKENAWYEPSEGIGEFKLVEPETVGQFAGLIDKNDKEIYEDDILKLKYPKDLRHNTTAIIVFDEQTKSLRFKVYESTEYYVLYNHLPKYLNFEVIGNIHDNPEMLEVSNA